MKAATAESTLKSTKKVLEDELAQEELVEFLDMDKDEPTEAAKDFKTSTWYSSSGTRCRRLDHTVLKRPSASLKNHQSRNPLA